VPVSKTDAQATDRAKLRVVRLVLALLGSSALIHADRPALWLVQSASARCAATLADAMVFVDAAAALRTHDASPVLLVFNKDPRTSVPGRAGRFAGAHEKKNWTS
jgi:hypothetical protein